jgi:oxygen-independent coproporphyrinogen-3 oxidase
LPGPAPHAQSQTRGLRQLKSAEELAPEHISAYGLTPEPNTSLEKALAEGRLVLPTEKEQASMYMAGAEFLESRGYMQYEISNYARLGFECRHNTGYWEGADYLGLGPGAVSTLGGRRWTNSEDMTEWQRAVKNRGIASGVEELDARTRTREMLMLRLRMNKGLMLQDWRQLTGRSFLEEYAPLVALLQQNALAATRSGRFRLTRSGMLVSNTILAHFMEGL